jgi:hypothetical protein
MKKYTVKRSKRGGETEVLSTTSIFNNTDVNIKQPQYISANMTYKEFIKIYHNIKKIQDKNIIYTNFITDYKASKSSKPSTTYEEFIQKDIENITTITNTFTNNKNKNDNDNIGLIQQPTDEEKAKITNLLSSDDYKIIIKDINISKHGILDISENNYLQGGAEIDLLTTENLDELTRFCRNYKGNPKESNSNVSNDVVLNNYQKIYTAIKSNNNQSSSSFKLPYILNYEAEKRITYNINDLLSYTILNFERNSIFYDYNKKIIMGYELMQHTYHNEIQFQQFIDKQQDYIYNLSNREKNIIKDYIYPSSYNIINEYFKKNKILDQSFYNIIDQELKTYALGNAFCDFILEEIPDLLDSVSAASYTVDLYKNLGIDYEDKNLYLLIPLNNWNNILNKYIIELQIIINNAPTVTEKFVTYRGVSAINKQIVENDSLQGTISEDVPISKTDRFISVSLNYEASNSFYNHANPDDSRLYRIIINKGCKLLFITPLAPNNLKNEMELLLPINSLLYSPDNFKPNKAYNSFDNKNNICLFEEDAINSVDLILVPP